MSRRGSPAVQVLVVVVVVLVFLYGFYSYHQQHTRLKLSEDLNEKLKQKSESFSAQLQVLYEHKTRLETAIQKEKEQHKTTKEQLEMEVKELENKFRREKDVAAAEFESCKKAAEESKLILEKADQETKRLQQEHQNDISRLKDDVANIKRRYDECEKLKLQAQIVDEGKSRSQPPVAESVRNNNQAGNVAGSDADRLQIIKPVDANIVPQPQDSVKVEGESQNIPKPAAPGQRQPDGRAVEQVNAPVAGSMDDGNSPLRNDGDVGRGRLDDAASVNDGKLVAKQQVPGRPSADQEQRQPRDDEEDNDRRPADSKNVGNVQKNDAADDYAGDIEGQEKNNKNENKALKFEANGIDNAANGDVERNNKDGAGL